MSSDTNTAYPLSYGDSSQKTSLGLGFLPDAARREKYASDGRRHGISRWFCDKRYFRKTELILRSSRTEFTDLIIPGKKKLSDFGRIVV